MNNHLDLIEWLSKKQLKFAYPNTLEWFTIQCLIEEAKNNQ